MSHHASVLFVKQNKYSLLLLACKNIIQKNDTIVCLDFNHISSSVLGRGVCCKDVNGEHYLKSITEGLLRMCCSLLLSEMGHVMLLLLYV